jgi:hypothetical protein
VNKTAAVGRLKAQLAPRVPYLFGSGAGELAPFLRLASAGTLADEGRHTPRDTCMDMVAMLGWRITLSEGAAREHELIQV